jgi:uncharacterized membrane protein
MSDHKSSLQEQSDFSGSPLPENGESKKGGGSTYNITMVIAVISIVLILYYSYTCFICRVAKKPTRKKTSSAEDVVESFDLEEEVQKLRIKQDQYKIQLGI